MSHTHIRIKRPPIPPFSRRAGIYPAVAVLVIILLILFALGRIGGPYHVEGGESAPGKILETRISLVSILNSTYGGAALYRIQAHVTYDLHGAPQDRWIPASETARRDELELRLARHPTTCLVFWNPSHPENPHCQINWQ